jgi:hypothetical protein
VCARVACLARPRGPLTSSLGVVTKRTTLAFFAAPLIAALLYAFIVPIWPTSPERRLPNFLGVLVIAFWGAGLLTVIVAMPAFLVLNRLHLVRWWSALGAGALVGLLFTYLFGGRPDPGFQGRLMLIGAASGLSFWVIARSGTPPNNRWRGP